MAKLTEDQIKWILSIDAKGVHKEIAVTSSEINRLAQDNRRMAQEMKAAQKQISEQEKEMAKLTRAGQQNSDAYREAKATRDAAKAEVEAYTQKIIENNHAIKENKDKLEEMEKSMSINEMSMKQLRQRAADLKAQLDATSAAANPKEYKALQKDLTAVENRMQTVGMQGKGLIAQFAGMNHPVGTAAKAVQGFGQALKALIMNPVGVVIMAIAIAFTALKKAINSSEEASNSFQILLAPFKALLDGLLYILQKIVVGFLNFTIAVREWAEKATEKIPFVGNLMKKLNDKSREAVALEKEKHQLRVRERESIVTNAQKERDIAELRNKAKQRDIYTNEQIIGFLDEAIKLEKEIAEEKIEQAKIALHILETEAARTQNTEEVNRKIAEQTALITQLDTEFYNSTRRMESERFSRIDEMRREEETAAKEALEKKISNIDFALEKETLLLKQQLANREITQDEYDRSVEQKTMESLNRKLEIVGLEREKRIEIEQQILDFKVKALELEEQFQKERETIAENWYQRFLAQNEKETQALNDKYEKELNDLTLAREKQSITEVEFLEYKAKLLEEKEKELAEKKIKTQEEEAGKELARLMAQKEQEEMSLKQAYVSGLISKEEYEQGLLAIEERYTTLSLAVENLSAESRMAIQKKLLDASFKNMEDETKKQEAEQKKRKQLLIQFSEQIGTMLAGVISGNEDMVKSSLKAVLNMALDALEAQITMSIASATAQSFAQADSVATWGMSGAARAAVLTALIKGAFAGVKAIVNNSLSGSKKSSDNSTSTTATPTGSYVVTGHQSGGFVDVTRQQDGKYFRALMNPRKRGFIEKPTVIVGDGPAGKSKEWVASNDALENPTVAPIIKLLNEAQQAGTIRTIDLNHLMRTRMAGLAGGGFLYDNPIADAMRKSGSSDPSLYIQRSVSRDQELIRDIRDLLSYFKENPIKAYMVYSEFQKTKETLEKSRKIGTRS